MVYTYVYIVYGNTYPVSKSSVLLYYNRLGQTIAFQNSYKFQIPASKESPNNISKHRESFELLLRQLTTLLCVVEEEDVVHL